MTIPCHTGTVSYPMPSLPVFLFFPLCAWAVGILAYRLFFHPLRNFPGPWLAALTYYYRGYYDLVQDGGFLSHIEALHSRYGPVVRVGPNTLHFSKPQAYSDIYTHGTSFVKSGELYDCFYNCFESSVGFQDPQKSRLRRNMLSPLFSRRAILQLGNVIQEKVDRLVSRLKEYPEGKPIDLTFAFRSLTMDVITSYCFSASYNTLEHPDFRHPLIMVIHESLKSLWVMKYFPFLNHLSMTTPNWILGIFSPRLLHYLRMKEDLEDRIEQYLRDESLLKAVEHETIFHHLILPKAKEGSIDLSLRPSKKSLVDEAFALIGAGSDTVGNTCCIGTFYALKNPAISGRLKQELYEAWPDADSPPNLAVLEQLPYLTAFIKESLRFSHGVVTPLPRIVGPFDTNIGGTLVPAGTSVEMSCVFLHKNPSLFENPEKFFPDRWMDPSSKELETHLVPFSKGPRMCLGINLAWCELYFIFGTIFRKLDMSLYDTTLEGFKDFREFFVPFWKGGNVRVAVKSSKS